MALLLVVQLGLVQLFVHLVLAHLLVLEQVTSTFSKIIF